MSSDSSDITPSTNPLEIAVEGLVIRPDAFDNPVSSGNGADLKTLVAPALAAVAREKADLGLTAAHVFPLWALVPIIGVVLAAGSFLGANMALGPNVKGYDYPLQFPDGAGSGDSVVVDEYDPKIWLAKGKGEYATVCASCHQATGEGIP
jgi:cytochrome c1